MRRWPRKKRNIFKRAMDMRGDMTVQADTRENVSVQAPCHCHSSSVRLLLLLTDPSCGIYNHPANTAPTSFHKTPVSTLSKSQLWPSPPKSQAALPLLSHNANERGEVRRWLGFGEYLRQLEVEKVQKSKHAVSAWNLSSCMIHKRVWPTSRKPKQLLPLWWSTALIQSSNPRNVSRCSNSSPVQRENGAVPEDLKPVHIPFKADSQFIP